MLVLVQVGVWRVWCCMGGYFTTCTVGEGLGVGGVCVEVVVARPPVFHTIHPLAGITFGGGCSRAGLGWGWVAAGGSNRGQFGRVMACWTRGGANGNAVTFPRRVPPQPPPHLARAAGWGLGRGAGELGWHNQGAAATHSDPKPHHSARNGRQAPHMAP